VGARENNGHWPQRNAKHGPGPGGLALSVIECAAIVYLYRAILTYQGRLLHHREQRILETVTTKEE
jgi:hypothetical protein